MPVTLHRANLTYQDTIFAPAWNRNTLIQMFLLMHFTNTYAVVAHAVKWLGTSWKVRVQFSEGRHLSSLSCTAIWRSSCNFLSKEGSFLHCPARLCGMVFRPSGSRYPCPLTDECFFIMYLQSKYTILLLLLLPWQWLFCDSCELLISMLLIEKYCRVGCNIMLFGRSSLTFRRNVLPSSSGSESEPNKMSAIIR